MFPTFSSWFPPTSPPNPQLPGSPAPSAFARRPTAAPPPWRRSAWRCPTWAVHWRPRGRSSAISGSRRTLRFRWWDDGIYLGLWWWQFLISEYIYSGIFNCNVWVLLIGEWILGKTTGIFLGKYTKLYSYQCWSCQQPTRGINFREI